MKRILLITRLVLLVVILLNVTTISAQNYGTLRGNVAGSEASCNVYDGVNIVLKQNGTTIIGATTKFDGTYYIRSIPPGTYDVEAISIHYFIKKKEIEIKLGEEIILDFQLEPNFTTYYGEVEIPPHNGVLISTGHEKEEVKSWSITGKVTDKSSNENIERAKITLRGSGGSYISHRFTKHDGIYSMTSVYPSTYEYNIVASCLGYFTETVKVQVKENEILELDFQLERETIPLEYIAIDTDTEMPSVSGKVTYKDSREKAVGVNIIFQKNNSFIAASKTSFYGMYNIGHIPAGTYEVVVIVYGYTKKKIEVEVKADENKVLDIQI